MIPTLSRRCEASHRLCTEILAEMRREADGLREGVIRFLASTSWEELGHVGYAEKTSRGTIRPDDCRDAIERARAQMDIEMRRRIGVYLKLSARKMLADLRAKELRERHDGQAPVGDT